MLLVRRTGTGFVCFYKQGHDAFVTKPIKREKIIPKFLLCCQRHAHHLHTDADTDRALVGHANELYGAGFSTGWSQRVLRQLQGAVHGLSNHVDEVKGLRSLGGDEEAGHLHEPLAGQDDVG